MITEYRFICDYLNAWNHHVLHPRNAGMIKYMTDEKHRTGFARQSPGLYNSFQADMSA